MKNITLTLIIFCSLLMANVAKGQTNIDNETGPGNNSVPGDAITLPANNDATLSNSSDVDYFKVNVTASGVLIINVTGTNANMKTRIEVVNPDGSTSEGYREANFASDDVSVEILAKTTGNYFIRVSNLNLTSNSSPYNLTASLNLSDTYELNNTIMDIASVTAVSVNFVENNPNILQGKIQGYYRTDYGWSGGAVFGNLAADVDIYKITTNSRQGVIVAKLENAPSNLKFRIEFIKSDGITTEGYRDASVNGDSLRLELLTQYAGIYYIKVSNINGNANGSGNTSSSPYTLKLWIDTLGSEYNNTPASLSAVNELPLSLDEINPNILQGKIRGYYRTDYGWSGGAVFGNLAADVDIYKITTNSKQGVIVAKLENVPSNLKFRIEFIKSDGITTEGYRDASVNGDSLRLELLTQYAGIYYIKVSNINGNANGSGNTSSSPYTLKLWIDTLGSEYNNTPASLSAVNELPLSLDEINPNILQGKIRGYYRTDYGWSGGAVFGNLAADVDIYKITTNSKQGVIVAKLENVPSNLKFRIEFIKSDGITTEGYRDASVNGDSLRLELLTQYAGIYYIKVSNINGNANGSGNTSSSPYTLKLWIDTLGNEFNNNTANAYIIDLNTSTKGKIRGYYRTDYGWSGAAVFANLLTDIDYYETTFKSACYKFQNATVSHVPANIKIKITAYDSTGTSLGSKTATQNGQTLILTSGNITTPQKVRYFKIENANTGNGTNTNSDYYLFSTSFNPTIITPTITPDNPTICSGGFVPLISSSENNYLWSTGETSKSISASTQGYYTVQVDSGGCFSGKDSVFVTVTQMPHAKFSATPTGLSVSFNAGSSTNATTFTWKFGDTNSGNGENTSHTYTTAGQYNVMLTACNGSCCDDTTIVVTVITTGINETNSSSYFSVLPNPCTQCYLTTTAQENDLTVTDILGRRQEVVFSKTSNGYLLNMNSHAAGIYLIRNAKSGEVRKFVKE